MIAGVGAVTATSAIAVVAWLGVQPLAGGAGKPSPTASATSHHKATGQGGHTEQAPQCGESPGVVPGGHDTRQPQYSPVLEWPLVQFHAHKLWAGTEGDHVKVAVVDTGIDSGQPDLRGAVVAFCDVSAGPGGDLSSHSHGTAVAGLIAGRGSATNRGQMAGLAPRASLIDVRVAAQPGGVTPQEIAKGIMVAVDKGARVINVSLGTATNDSQLTRAVQRAVDKGCLVVASAGDSSTAQYPADDPGVLRVAAVSRSHQTRSSLSPGGSGGAVYAPGVNLFSTAETSGPHKTSGGYVYDVSGADYATAYVSATAALLLSARPRLTPAAMEQAMLGNSTPIPGVTGFGLLNPGGALRAVQGQRQPPPPTSRANPGTWLPGWLSRPATLLFALALLILVAITGWLSVWPRRAARREGPKPKTTRRWRKGHPAPAAPHVPAIWDEP